MVTLQSEGGLGVLPPPSAAFSQTNVHKRKGLCGEGHPWGRGREGVGGVPSTYRMEGIKR